jgi:hypothetical protein
LACFSNEDSQGDEAEEQFVVLMVDGSIQEKDLRILAVLKRTNQNVFQLDDVCICVSNRSFALTVNETKRTKMRRPSKLQSIKQTCRTMMKLLTRLAFLAFLDSSLAFTTRPVCRVKVLAVCYHWNEGSNALARTFTHLFQSF